MTYSMLRCHRLVTIASSRRLHASMMSSSSSSPPLIYSDSNSNSSSSSSSRNSRRFLSASTAYQAQDFKSRQDRTAMNTESSEYSQTASDDDAAQRGDAFDRHDAAPPPEDGQSLASQAAKTDDSDQEHGSLAVSPARRSISHAPADKEINPDRNEGRGSSRQGRSDKAGTGKVDT